MTLNHGIPTPGDHCNRLQRQGRVRNSQSEIFFLGSQLKCFMNYEFSHAQSFRKGPEASTSGLDYKKYWPTYQGRNSKVQKEKLWSYMGFSLPWLSRRGFATYFFKVINIQICHQQWIFVNKSDNYNLFWELHRKHNLTTFLS